MLNKSKGISGGPVHNGSVAVLHRGQQVGVHNKDITICGEGQRHLGTDVVHIEKCIGSPGGKVIGPIHRFTLLIYTSENLVCPE